MNKKISKKQEINKKKRGNPNFKKGASGNPKGRPKGTKNKFTSLKQAFLDAFNDERVGSTEGLIQFVKKNDKHRAMFYQWLTKMLPTNIVEEITGEIKIRQQFENRLDEYFEEQGRDGIIEFFKELGTDAIPKDKRRNH